MEKRRKKRRSERGEETRGLERRVGRVREQRKNREKKRVLARGRGGGKGWREEEGGNGVGRQNCCRMWKLTSLCRAGSLAGRPVM